MAANKKPTDTDNQTSSDTESQTFSGTGNQTSSGTGNQTSSGTGNQTFAIRLKTDYWDANGKRKLRGDTISVPRDEAVKLLNAKLAERTDPLPGMV